MTRKALSAPFVAAPPGAVSSRTRLFLSPSDEAVLTEVGEHLGSLLRGDLAARCRLGAGSKHLGRAERKKALTPLSSSRWAGSVTRTVDDMWERGYLNLKDLAARDRREILEIERRSALAVGRGKGRKKGYVSRFERHQKQRRLQRLRARLASTEARLEDARVSVVVGSKRLLRNRHNLEKAELNVEEWREKWDARRMFLRAGGETGKRWGNETIRVVPDADGDYRVAIRLPTPLSHLSNTLGRGTAYLLSEPIEWHYLHDEWKAQASRHRAVGYRIHRDPENGQ